MNYADVAIPLGSAWSSPFAKWQGTLAEVHSLDLAVAVTSRALAERGISPEQFDGVVLGWTVPQRDIFYGAPTLAGRLGVSGLSGPMVAQACATSVAALHAAAGAVSAGAGPQLVVTTDRTSNGPTLSWPAPSAMAGAPVTSHWVLDSFARDPWAGAGMLTAAEAVVAEMEPAHLRVPDPSRGRRWPLDRRCSVGHARTTRSPSTTSTSLTRPGSRSTT